MSTAPVNTRTVTDVACTVCGCVCDDLTIRVSNDQIASVEGACELAKPWFQGVSSANPGKKPAAWISGCEAPLTEAIARAAEILAASRAPLVWGLARSSTEGQRAAVELGERIGATVDTTASVCHGPSIMAIQQVGESTCSLGEVRNRADLVIFWGANPVVSHPRHLERYSLEPRGEFVPGGRADRTLVVIDSEQTETAALADVYVEVPIDQDFEVIWALRQLLKGIELPADYQGPIPLAQLQNLLERMRNCRYGVVFFGLGLARRGIGQANVEALLKLVEDLNQFTRFTARRLRIPGDVSGADAVLCWQTGFPFAVSLSRGYPRYNPGEYTANELLERREVDACLLVGSEPIADLSLRAREFLKTIPTIALDYPHVQPPLTATVQFTTAVYGIHRAGTAYRMDEVPIPLRPVVTSDYSSDGEVLRGIIERLGVRNR